jgi:hypothetical protein
MLALEVLASPVSGSWRSAPRKAAQSSALRINNRPRVSVLINSSERSLQKSYSRQFSMIVSAIAVPEPHKGVPRILRNQKGETGVRSLALAPPRAIFRLA